MNADLSVRSAHSPAVVLGFNIHGLAVARALAKAGIEVHAFTVSKSLPTSLTKYASVYDKPGVNSEELIDLLEEFSRDELAGRKAVLFPTNDNMVRALANQWPRLEGSYLLSWASCRDAVLHLQHKDNLPALCERQGIDHPRSYIVRQREDCTSIANALAGPILVKPVKPLSSFKAIKLQSLSDLDDVVRRYSSDLPLIVQAWVEGGDDTLYFCALYLRDGEEIAHFTGRKYRSAPRGLGQGVVMASYEDPQLLALARKFVDGINISGPIAVEFKKDVEGRYWLIEPNIGRTEYCVDLLIQSGVNLPLLEYEHAVGRASRSVAEPAKAAWYDTDKSLLCFVQEFGRRSELRDMAIVFPYWGHNDFAPFLHAWVQRLCWPWTEVVRRMSLSRVSSDRASKAAG